MSHKVSFKALGMTLRMSLKAPKMTLKVSPKVSPKAMVLLSPLMICKKKFYS